MFDLARRDDAGREPKEPVEQLAAGGRRRFQVLRVDALRSQHFLGPRERQEVRRHLGDFDLRFALEEQHLPHRMVLQILVPHDRVEDLGRRYQGGLDLVERRRAGGLVGRVPRVAVQLGAGVGVFGEEVLVLRHVPGEQLARVRHARERRAQGLPRSVQRVGVQDQLALLRRQCDVDTLRLEIAEHLHRRAAVQEDPAGARGVALADRAEPLHLRGLAFALHVLPDLRRHGLRVRPGDQARAHHGERVHLPGGVVQRVGVETDRPEVQPVERGRDAGAGRFRLIDRRGGVALLLVLSSTGLVGLFVRDGREYARGVRNPHGAPGRDGGRGAGGNLLGAGGRRVQADRHGRGPATLHHVRQLVRDQTAAGIRGPERHRLGSRRRQRRRFGHLRPAEVHLHRGEVLAEQQLHLVSERQAGRRPRHAQKQRLDR